MLLVGQSLRAETFYEATNETCYNPEETRSLARRLQGCDICELDLKTMENAYKAARSARSSAPFPLDTFLIGFVGGALTAVVIGQIATKH